MDDEIIRFQDKLYIAAGSQRGSIAPEVMKSGDTFAVFDQLGEIGATGVHEHGVYFLGTRHLSRWELFVNDCRPMLLNSAVTRDNTRFVVQMTTPDAPPSEEHVLPHGMLHIFRTLRLDECGFTESLRLTNYAPGKATLTLEFRFAADYVDVFEVRGASRKHRGETLAPATSPQSISLGYRGLDECMRTTGLVFSGDFRNPLTQPNRFQATLDLEKGMTQVVQADITFQNVPLEGGDASRTCYVASPRVGQNSAEQDPVARVDIATSNRQFNGWINRSLADLNMLTTQTPYGPYPYAGVPWFATPFGRDALITCLQTIWALPDLARGTLSFLAAHQAHQVDDDSEAQPGKILHEMRDGEMAAIGEVPFRCYYGAVDSTPLFVTLAGEYYRRTHDLEFLQSIWPNVQRALQWIDEYGDVDGDGFVEYQAHNQRGLVHQCWKDSNDSIFHSDGREPEFPLAASEVQGYVYRAKLDAAELSEAMGDGALAKSLRLEAGELKRRFNQAFFRPSIQTYALALDAEKQPCEVRSSNSGHLLYSGVVDAAYAETVSRTLTQSSSFNGWGIRTISAGEARYNPMSYHNGSVWPHDTAIGAAGLANYGFKEAALAVFNGLYEASLHNALHRLPELFCGFDRLAGQGPVLWPVACSPQAWAAGASLMFLQYLTGLSFKAEESRIYFHRPTLPSYLKWVRIRNLSVNTGVADVVLHRHAQDVGLHVERRVGDVKIVVVN